MTEAEKTEIRLLRTKQILTGLTQTLRKFLPSMNGVSSTNRESVVAFDLLERCCYNSRGVLFLFDEYVANHNMSLPLSQIFRSMAYDVIIAYWLFGEDNVFADRIKGFNGEFVRRNSKRLSELVNANSERSVDEVDKQRIWRGWQKDAPENFTENTNGSIEPSRVKEYTFDEISKRVVQENNKSFLSSLPLV